MENKLKTLEEAKNIFENLKTDTKSTLFSEEKLNMRLLKKLKKSDYSKDKLLLKLINLIENDIGQITQAKEGQIPTRLDYVEKREIDRSTLYSFDGPFQLIHADVAKLEFFGKVYVYPVYSRKQILQRLEQFYKEVRKKRKKETCGYK